METRNYRHQFIFKLEQLKRFQNLKKNDLLFILFSCYVAIGYFVFQGHQVKPQALALWEAGP